MTKTLREEARDLFMECESKDCPVTINALAERLAIVDIAKGKIPVTNLRRRSMDMIGVLRKSGMDIVSVGQAKWRLATPQE